MTTTSTLDLPGMTSTSPRLGRTGMMTMTSGYDMTPRSMVRYIYIALDESG